MSKESRLLKNTAIIAVGNICMKCISFLMFPLYTAILTVSEYGTVDFILVIGSLLVSLLTLRIHEGIFRFLIEARGDKKRIATVISTGCGFLGGMIVGFAVLTWLLMALDDYSYILLTATYVIFLAFSYTSTNIARGLGDNITYTIASCVGGSLRVLLNVVFLVVFKLGIRGMLFAELIASICTGIYPVIRIHLWDYFSLKAFDSNVLKQLLLYSLPLVPYTICWWAIAASSRMIISIMLGTAANGIYSVCTKFSNTYTLATDIFKISWTESAAENVNDRGRDVYYQKILDKSIQLYSSVNVGIIAIMPFVFPVLINDQFSEAYNYIPFLMFSALLYSASNLFGSVYTALKRTKEIAVTTIASAVINVFLNLLLVPYIGIYGAAFASVVAYSLIAVAQYMGIYKMVSYQLSSRYLLRELAAYGIVIAGYYSQRTLIQIFVLITLIPYCVISNWDVVKVVFEKILKKKAEVPYGRKNDRKKRRN